MPENFVNLTALLKIINPKDKDSIEEMSNPNITSIDTKSMELLITRDLINSKPCVKGIKYATHLSVSGKTEMGYIVPDSKVIKTLIKFITGSPCLKIKTKEALINPIPINGKSNKTINRNKKKRLR